MDVAEVPLAELKKLIDICTVFPKVLHRPELAFLKSFIERFGGKIPSINELSEKLESKNVPKEPESKPTPEPEPEEESEESDLELDMTGVIEPDADIPQKMGNLTLQPTEEEIAESQAKRSEAVSAFVEKDYEKAIELYTEAIVLNPKAPLLYAKRGQIYLMMNKPNACIRNCNRALELNSESAAAHKFRGRAYHLLGKFEEAANDLRLACKFDFDDQAEDWLRAVTPNARKIEEHKRKKERKMQEKLERERQEKIKKAQETIKAAQENTRTSQTESNKRTPRIDLSQFFNDDEIFQTLQDPEVDELCKEIALFNPKIMALVNKVANKFGDTTNMPSFLGKTGGMPNFSPIPNDPQSPKESDVGLD